MRSDRTEIDSYEQRADSWTVIDSDRCGVDPHEDYSCTEVEQAICRII